jgi:predicted RNase H-like nuclease (RuvC/YqgF family)
MPEKLQAEENGIRIIKERLSAASDAIRDLDKEVQEQKGRVERANAEKNREHKVASTKEDLQAKLRDLEDKIGPMEEAIRNIKKEIENSSVARTGGATVEELRRNVIEANRESEQLSAELEKVGKEAKENGKMYVIEGTQNRSATFADCSAAGIAVNPGNLRLGLDPNDSDKDVFLAAAKRTKYVVFLIRPDGYKSFSQYYDKVRSQNQSSFDRIDIGYEPVNADWILKYPNQEQ